jgi:hypothetical protein
MTPLFWQQRPSRKLITVLLFVIVLATVFFYRSSIAIKSIEYFAKPLALNITCLDFSLDWRLNIKVEQACITFPAGEILVREAIWQPWSNILNIKQVKLKHLATNFKVDEKHLKEEQTNEINLPDSLPTLRISNFEIDSTELLHPLHLSLTTIASKEFLISGDINASFKMQQNTIVGNLVWSLSELTKLLPVAEKLSQDNAKLLSELSTDKSKIQTHFTFDGKVLGANSSLNIASHFDLPNCPFDSFFKGDVLVDLDLSSFNTRFDLSKLDNEFTLVHCPLLQKYFAEGDLPQLSFIFPQKVTIDETQIGMPQLQIVDKGNANRSVVFTDLNFKTTGELDLNYNISVKHPIKTKRVEAVLLDFQAQGTVSADIATLNTQRSISWKIIDDNNRLAIRDMTLDALIIGNLTSEFSFHHLGTKLFEMKGTVNSSDIQTGNIKLAKSTSDFTIAGENFNDLQLSIDSQFFQLDHPNAKVQNISNHLDVNIKELATLSFTGNSTVTNFAAQKIKFLPMTMNHLGQVSLSEMTVSSQHNITLEQKFKVGIEQQKTKFALQVEQQDILALKKIIAQLEKQFILKQGLISARLDFTLPQENESFIAQGKAKFQGVSAKYKNYVFNNITYQTPLTFDSAGLQLAESTLHIDSINAGVPIAQLDAKVIAKDNVFRLEQLQGEIFNGRFSTSQLWLDGRDQQVNINFQHIDLAQVVALQQQPGIKLTGNIDGDLPMIINKQGISIDEGWASSLSGGKLTIIDNPSFDSIKLQQPQLALLENLDFTQLKSNVKFTPDGWMFFDFALNGNNPDKKQSVNFNYTHQENIFSLLESIRLVNAVEDKIEQKITQGDKK